MRYFTIQDYQPPAEGWSEFLRTRGRAGAVAYLSNMRNLKPGIYHEFLAWKKHHPEARIVPTEASIFSRNTHHFVKNPPGYPPIR